MGLLDKLLGRDPKPATDTKAEHATATSDEQLLQRDDQTSPHHHAEQEADAADA